MFVLWLTGYAAKQRFADLLGGNVLSDQVIDYFSVSIDDVLTLRAVLPRKNRAQPFIARKNLGFGLHTPDLSENPFGNASAQDATLTCNSDTVSGLCECCLSRLVAYVQTLADVVNRHVFSEFFVESFDVLVNKLLALSRVRGNKQTYLLQDCFNIVLRIVVLVEEFDTHQGFP